MTRWRLTRSGCSATRCSSGRPRPSPSIDGALAKLVDAMYETMYEAHGVGLRRAAGRRAAALLRLRHQRRDRPARALNPEIVETSGEWTLRRGLPLAARPRVRDRAAQGRHRAGPRPRRQRGRDRGRRAARPGVPARDRPPRRRADARPARPRRSARKRCASCASRGWAARRRAVGNTPCDRATPVTGASVRLVYLGTPDRRGPAAARARRRPATTSRSSSRSPTAAGRAAAGADPSPVRVAAEELGLPVRTPVKAREIVDDVRASGAELGVVVAFGQLLPGPVARSAAARLREPALLAAAALARRGAGRAGDARGRHRDRRVPDAARSRARHRAGVRDRDACRSARARPRASCAPGWSRSAPQLLVEQLPRSRRATPVPQVGRADLRREADGRGVPARSAAPGGRARPARARRQPAAGRVDARSAAGG